MKRSTNTVNTECNFCRDRAHYDIPTYMGLWAYTCLECAVLFGASNWQTAGRIIMDYTPTREDSECVER